jgi:hypothetical protein
VSNLVVQHSLRTEQKQARISRNCVDCRKAPIISSVEDSVVSITDTVSLEGRMVPLTLEKMTLEAKA